MVRTLYYTFIFSVLGLSLTGQEHDHPGHDKKYSHEGKQQSHSCHSHHRYELGIVTALVYFITEKKPPLA